MSEKGRFTNIPLSMLPMDDISKLLDMKYEFANKDGLGVESFDQLAIATEKDRYTVQNAMALGGIGHEMYMTKKDGEVMKAFASEVSDIRDELYQVKAELGRKGLITNYDNYAGFHETFRSDDSIYVKESVGKVVDVSPDYSRIIVDELAYNSFAVNDWIAVSYDIEDQEPAVVRVIHKQDNNILRVQPGLPVKATPEKTSISKSLGQYYKGSFAFIEDAGVQAGEVRRSSLDDDTYTDQYLFNDASKGLFYTFKINDFFFDGKSEGFFCEMRLRASRKGNPGALVAYLMYEDYMDQFDGTQSEVFLNSLCIAKSRPASLDNLGDGQVGTLRFDFLSEENGAYPRVSNSRLCLVITALDNEIEKGFINANNAYSITFVNGASGSDLQTNNKLYVYDRTKDGEVSYDKEKDGLAGQILYYGGKTRTSDLHYEYHVRPELDESLHAHKSGLYTKKFKSHASTAAQRARVTMRINREGLFKITETKTTNGWVSFEEDRKKVILENGKPVEVEAPGLYNMSELGGLGAMLNDQIIIGSQFGKYNEQQMAKSVLIDKNLLVEKDSPIYRMGYHLFLRAKQIDVIENELGEMRTQVTKEIQRELDLMTVIPDRNRRNEHVSDRLVFECDLLDEEDDAQYNHFELQIAWATSYANMSAREIYPIELHGAIKDLVLSLERRY